MVTKRAFLYGCVGCACGLGSGALLARDGVEVNKEASVFANLVAGVSCLPGARIVAHVVSGVFGGLAFAVGVGHLELSLA